MTTDNVEVVRRVLAAYSDRDVETLIDSVEEAAEWEPVGPAAIERALYRAAGLGD